MIEVMSEIVVAGCVNLEIIDNQDSILCGAGIYSSVSAAKFANQVTMIGCIGKCTADNLLYDLYEEFQKLPLMYVIQKKNGKNFVHHIDTVMMTENKELGNYKEFLIEDVKIHAKYLILGTGTPKFQRSILDSCEGCEFLAFDSKEIYYVNSIEELLYFFPRVDLYAGTENEICLLLSHLRLTSVQSLFLVFDRLQYIFYKAGANGGHLYLRNGKVYSYTINMNKPAINDCGAGDILLGAFVGLISKYGAGDIKKLLIDSVKIASASTVFNGFDKLKENDISVTVQVLASTW